MALPVCTPPNPSPHAPRLKLPPGACDSHCHVTGPFDRFPPPEDRTYDPALAPETELRRLHDTLGIDRAVIVHAQGHGSDHRPMLAALEAGAGRYKGVAVLSPAATKGEVSRLNDAGVCGVRFNFLTHLGGHLNAAEILGIISMVRPYGWHVSLHLAGMDVVTHSELIRSLGAPVVIDHIARVDITEGPGGPAVSEIRRLIDTGSVWVKLSGAERLSKAGAPYADVVPIARSLADHAPERILWATDWPHVNLKNPMPDDGDLVELIAEIAPDEAVRKRMLVDNPAAFFGFPTEFFPLP